MDSEYTRLTVQDIEVLLGALKAWESKDLAGEMMVTLLGGIGAKTPEDRAMAKAQNEHRWAEYAEKTNQRKETSVILQAKLIQMRQKLTADAFIESGGLS